MPATVAAQVSIQPGVESFPPAVGNYSTVVTAGTRQSRRFVSRAVKSTLPSLIGRIGVQALRQEMRFSHSLRAIHCVWFVCRARLFDHAD